MEEKKFYQEIIGKLERLFKREYLFLCSLGIQGIILITAAAVTSLALLELIFHFSSNARTAFVLIFAVLFSLGAVLFVLLPILKYLKFLRNEDYYSAAGKVGLQFPHIKDDLLNAMQLVSKNSRFDKFSPELKNAAFRDVYVRTKDVNFESIVSFKKSKELLRYLAAVLIICAAAFGFSAEMQSAGGRLIAFNKEFTPPPRYAFDIYPGDAEITKGERLTIKVNIIGGIPQSVQIAVKTEEETEYKFEKLFPDSSGTYSLNIPAVRSSFQYYVSATEAESGTFTINVVDRPVIYGFDLTIKPPAYSKLPEIKQKDNGNISALRGSRVELNVSSSKDLSGAKIVFEDSAETDFRIRQESAETNFTVVKNNSYYILLKDKSGNTNENAIKYSINVLEDAYPGIELISPAQNVNLDNDNRLSLLAKINDDFGFSKLLLKYRLSSSRYEEPWNEYRELEIPLDKGRKEDDISFVWNLTSLNMAVDDVVTYFLEVYDNDTFGGPKSAKTPEYTVRVPSLDEILKRSDEMHTDAETDLKEILKEAAELKKDLEKIDQNLKQDKKELTWEEKQQIEQALDKFEKMQEKSEEVSENISKMQEELQKNDLLSKETLEKYMELQKLFDELSSEEMKQAMERMQKMMETLNRQNTQNQMQDLKIDEEKFQKSIERTLELLKRVQVEQKINEMLKRTESLEKKQEEIQKKTNDTDLKNPQDNKSLQNQQENISENLEKFRDEMKKLEEMMQDLEQMPKEELEKLREEFEKQQNAEKSDKAKQNLKNQQKDQAMQQMQQLQKNMQQMNSMMQQMQQNMMQQNQMQTFKEMMRVLDNLLTLSKQQEQLKKETENTDYSAQQLNDKSLQQRNLERSLENILKQMSDLSKKTFAITPEMGKALGDAKKQMQNSLQALQNRNGSFSAMSQGESMKSLNEAATMMKGGMESMMQGGGQGGMMPLMQQLGQLSQQQMNLNNMTQMLQQMQQGGLSQQQQAEMKRLAQQQEMIRKSLEELNKEAQQSGKSKTLPGNLNDIVKKMSEVISDMNTERLDDPLIQKQEKILSRMLDAQRSINERDFEKQRESYTGQNILRDSPEELNLNGEKGKNRIREELNRAVNEGYLRDYEELIKKYYELIEKEEVN